MEQVGGRLGCVMALQVRSELKVDVVLIEALSLIRQMRPPDRAALLPVLRRYAWPDRSPLEPLPRPALKFAPTPLPSTA